MNFFMGTPFPFSKRHDSTDFAEKAKETWVTYPEFLNPPVNQRGGLRKTWVPKTGFPPYHS